MVTDAYHRRCAITGERTLPVLEAAHIKPFSKEGPNNVKNGLLLRSDVHKLFDLGFVTVTPDLHIEVSKRIKEEYENGREYYAYHGNELKVTPDYQQERPSQNYLQWHNEQVFVVEGEKCVDALVGIGRAAVTTAGSASSGSIGAGGKNLLAGKNVIIWRDNDEPGFSWALRMARELWPVAGSVRIVVYGDGGAGADAADYVVSGGQIDDILAPRTSYANFVDTDYIRAVVETDIGPCTFHFEDMFSKGNDSIECELTVNVISQAGIDTPYSQRINILSSSAKESLVRVLTRQFGDKPSPGGWTEVVSRAWAAMTGARRNNPRALKLEEPRDYRVNWQVEGLLPLGEDSIVFAKEGSGKSLFTLCTAVSVATGTPMGGKLQVVQGPVIYVDYERDKPKFESLLGRVARGVGIESADVPDLPIFYWPADGIPFPEQSGDIRREVAKLGAVLVIIDSLGFAVGGDMFDPSAPIKFYRKRVGCTTLAVGQVPAADDDKLYGNKYWMYAPHGMVWQMKMARVNGGSMEWRFSNRKYSDGFEPRNYTFDVSLDNRAIAARLI